MPPVIGSTVTLNFNGTGGFTLAGAAGTPVDVSTNPPTLTTSRVRTIIRPTLRSMTSCFELAMINSLPD